MAVLHDYECPVHGIFEARAPRKCPFKGCTEEIGRVFLKAPGLKSDRTKGLDKTTRQLAMEYKMTDVKSTREGEYQTGYMTRNNKPIPKDVPGSGVIWGGNDRMSMASALSGRLAHSVRGEQVGLKPRDVGVNRGPTTASYMADPENLKIKT